ncbi:MAG: VOC family protein [Dehalococcoidia bacterium]
MPELDGLGHVAIHCEDLMKMRDFYTRVMGLKIADEDLEGSGMCFLSTDPGSEHHEFVLAPGRNVPRDGVLVNQISWKVKTLDALRDFYNLLEKEPNARIQRSVSHGNALSFYVFDPEDNRLELYYKTGYKVRQPHRDLIDLNRSNEELLADAKALEGS